MRKICVITGARSEYGLLRWVMEDIRSDLNLELQVIVTGMHLSPEFGFTYQDVERDGFKIDRKVEMLLSSDTSAGVAKSIGLGLIGIVDAISDLKPDLILVLGDRFEVFSAVSAALVLRIPVAHLHGGEVTEGSLDDSLRHAITKMSHIHFVAAEAYQKRVIQLGEDPKNVYLVGGLGLDYIDRLSLLSKSDLEKKLNFKFLKKNLLITFHPVALDEKLIENQMQELLRALANLNDTSLIFTMPNSDAYGRSLAKMISSFVSKYSNAHAYISLGQLSYLSCLRYVDGVVGNSSSGLIEAPSFKKGTINIGDRQRGRLQAASVINCEPFANQITDAINQLYSEEFQLSLANVSNPYGCGGASKKIIQIIRQIDFSELIRKKFHDQIN